MLTGEPLMEYLQNVVASITLSTATTSTAHTDKNTGSC